MRPDASVMTIRAGLREDVNELQLALATDAAFEAWYARTLPRVYAYVFSRSGNDVALAEEITQQAFIAAVEQRSRFDGRSDTITWVCGIARNKLADHFRRKAREERRQMRLEVRQLELDRDATHAPTFDDRAAIADALRSLPTNQRAVLSFVVLDDLPVAEAARLMGLRAGAAQSLLYRARASFRRAYLGTADAD
jgi:RNA polymerase sigma-70 factor, ECF subfamily